MTLVPGTRLGPYEITAKLGEADVAFEVFRWAEDQNPLWPYYTGLPGAAPLRSDPRFEALSKKLGPSE